MLDPLTLAASLGGRAIRASAPDTRRLGSPAAPLRAVGAGKATRPSRAASCRGGTGAAVAGGRHRHARERHRRASEHRARSRSLRSPSRIVDRSTWTPEESASQSAGSAAGTPHAPPRRRRPVPRLRITFRRRLELRWIRSPDRQSALGSCRATAAARSRDAGVAVWVLAIARCSGGGLLTPPRSCRRVHRTRLELSRPGGTVALLVPAKLASSGYAEPLRQRLTHSTRIERAAPLPPSAARGFGAAVYPMALVATRADPGASQSIATTLGPKPEAPVVPQQQLQGSGPWILAAGAERIARRMRTQFPTVGDRWTPQLGVKTGADDVFLMDRECPGSRPAIRGRDIRPWRCEPRRFVVWTHGADGKPLVRLPEELRQMLAPHDERLRRRADYRGRCGRHSSHQPESSSIGVWPVSENDGRRPR